jgi:hypothetical protein
VGAAAYPILQDSAGHGQYTHMYTRQRGCCIATALMCTMSADSHLVLLLLLLCAGVDH